MTRTLFVLLLALPFLAACEDAQQEAPPPDQKLVTTGSAPPVAFVEVTTSAGNFTLRLAANSAPLTAARHCALEGSCFAGARVAR